MTDPDIAKTLSLCVLGGGLALLIVVVVKVALRFLGEEIAAFTAVGLAGVLLGGFLLLFLREDDHGR